VCVLVCACVCVEVLCVSVCVVHVVFVCVVCFVCVCVCVGPTKVWAKEHKKGEDGAAIIRPKHNVRIHCDFCINFRCSKLSETEVIKR
jgi:hypothetical protein